MPSDATLKLETSRLILRYSTLDDLDSYHSLVSSPDVMYYLQDIKTASLEETRERLLYVIEDMHSPNRTQYFFRMETKDTHEYIGETGYTVTVDTSLGKLVHAGYFIFREYWGKGYMTEAFNEVLRYAFEENNVFRLETGCIAENKGSEKVMIKCGLIKEAERKQCSWHDGKLKDRVEYRMLNSEWKR